MSKLKKIAIGLSFCLVLIISFCASYLLSSESLNKANKLALDLNKQSTGDKSIITNAAKEDIVSKDTKITFKIQYKKSDETFDEKTESPLTNIIGKTKKELEEIYWIKGYIINEMDSKHVNFLKCFDRYSPNKYVIDIYKEGNCIAIFKTDSEGKETIEEPSSDIKSETKISDVREGDLDTITRGQKTLQFDTKEEAIENYKVLFHS